MFAMVSSGITVDPECHEKFTALKLEPHTVKWLTCKFDKQCKRIEVDDLEEHPKGMCRDDLDPNCYGRFLSHLRRDCCRYALYDFEMLDSGRPISKIILVQWNGDNARIKEKILLSSSASEVKRAFDGCHEFIQACSEDECSLQAVKRRLTSKMK